MSFVDRISRLVDSFDVISNDEKINFGMKGEELARKSVDKEEGLIIYNPIIPHPKDNKKFLETDIIIYNNNCVYCIEIKNYKGEITFIPKYKRVKVEKRFLFFFKYIVERTVQDGWDDNKIIKKKVGNYNEKVFCEEYPNPMKKTKNYIYNLKRYLAKEDRRFNNIFIVPVVAFNRKNANISRIYSFDEGYIYIDEIDKYIKYHFKSLNKQLDWIERGLEALSTWDTLKTSTGENIYGIIKGNYIEVITQDNNQIKIPYDEIINIKIKKMSLFSKEDILIIKFLNNEIKEFKNIRGTIVLDKFGELQKHKISNLKYIDVGTNALRINNYI